MSSFSWTIIVSSFTFFALVNSIPDYSDLPPGPYCASRNSGCCDGRVDECAAPILGTMCYCDDFCNRTRAEDCCPDFWTFCKGIETPPEPIKSCYYNGEYYYQGKTAKENCNVCKCENVGTRMEMLCEQNTCLIEPNILSALNQNRHSRGLEWTATNYSAFWGRGLDEGIQLRLGTLQPHRFVMRMTPVRRIYDADSLPKQFDSEETWPGYISNIQDQGWCGSSWAISTAAVASDRFAVISKGRERVHLSPQHLLSCDNRGQQSCSGGYLDRAWNFVRKFGIVDEDCLPYVGKNSERCRIPRRGNLLTARCVPPTEVDRKDFYRTAPAYRLGNETDIMYEIIKSGPVQATMKVYHDFFMYKDGVYSHSDLTTSDRTGYHSVRIIGWGEEISYTGRTKYWKVANSWGRQWGEDGFFRILKGSNECEIESFVLATWPEIAKEHSNDVY